jgi:hypothetical protein
MPRYEPIDTGLSFKVSLSDLVAFSWATNGICADFAVPGDDQHLLRVKFDRSCIVRILDEMAISTESDDTESEGLIPEHFAYRIQEAAFFRMQSEAWKLSMKGPAHYRFITGWACLDVLSSAFPSFELIEK